MKTIVRILNYYLNPIFNNALDVWIQLTRVSWWVFGNFITIWIETKCWAEGQDVTTITSWSHHLSDFFIWKLKFKAPSGTIGKAFECVSCLTRDPLNFFPNLIRRRDSKQLSPSGSYHCYCGLLPSVTNIRGLAYSWWSRCLCGGREGNLALN